MAKSKKKMPETISSVKKLDTRFYKLTKKSINGRLAKFKLIL